MLVPNSKYVLTSSPSNSVIAAYSLKTRQFSKLLTSHREPPQCLVQLNSQHFASGSLDGMVVMWNSDTLMSLRVFSSPEAYLSKDKVYVYRVACLVPLGPKHIAAAIGNGFSVFDVHTGDVVLQCPNAHNGSVTCIVSVCNGTCLLTSSDDSVIKLWLVPQHLLFRVESAVSSNSSPGSIPSSSTPLRLSSSSSSSSAIILGNNNSSDNSNSSSGGGDAVSNENSAEKDRGSVPKPRLMAELWGHSGAVTEIVKMSEYSFASCSSDTSVILWKDGRRQVELRNVYTAISLACLMKD